MRDTAQSRRSLAESSLLPWGEPTCDVKSVAGDGGGLRLSTFDCNVPFLDRSPPHPPAYRRRASPTTPLNRAGQMHLRVSSN